SDKKSCHERPGSPVTPRMKTGVPDLSPPLKQARLKAVRQRSDSISLGRLAFFRHLERVETMRCFWELKHIELNQDFQESEGTHITAGCYYQSSSLSPRAWQRFPPQLKATLGSARNSGRAMEGFLKGRDLWLVSSVCLMASYLWRRLWDLLSYRRKGRSSSSLEVQESASKVSRSRVLRTCLVSASLRKSVPFGLRTERPAAHLETQMITSIAMVKASGEMRGKEEELIHLLRHSFPSTSYSWIDYILLGRNWLRCAKKLAPDTKLPYLQQTGFLLAMTSMETSPGIDLIQVRIESLSSKMDTLISIQEKVLSRLDSMSQDLDGIERDMETLKLDKEEIHMPPGTRNEGPARGARGEMKEMCQEMSSIMTAVNQRSEQQAQKLEGMERLVLSIQQVVGFIGETVKTSKVMELMFKGPAARKNKTTLSLGPNKAKQTAKKQASGEVPPGKKATSIKSVKGTEELILACEPSILESTHKLNLHGPKHFLSSKKSFNFLKDHKLKDGKLSFKVLKAQKKKKPPDTTDAASLKKQALLLEEVQKLNRENAERSTVSVGMEVEAPLSQNLLDFILEETKAPIAEQEELSEEEQDAGVELKKEEEAVKVENGPEEMPKEEAEEISEELEEVGKEDGSANVPAVEAESCEPEHVDEVTTSSKRRVTEEDLELEDHKKSRVEEDNEEEENKAELPEDLHGVFKADGVELHIDFSKQKQEEDEVPDESECEQFFIELRPVPVRIYMNCTPPPLAPFSHRVVSAKPNQINNFYTINRQEVLGGSTLCSNVQLRGRFGQVHKCIENSSGLTLAAKIIKARSPKEKEVVKNEIQVMNQLDHANLIQLYAAYESRNDIILVLEYVDGGELFDRIIDENYKLTELDTVMFIRQICEGLRYMHKMYILHLDLKPENILCVSRLTNKVKIIDFGLARKYIPREKLRVNFGTPEFLAPEVINYDFVSFNTDMWSLGVISYMLLSGLSPFLGDDDNETLNNILSCQWNFEEDEFLGISSEAKDFISKLLVFNKSWRIGAGEALKHPWLSDPELHHRLHEKRNMCRSRRNSCLPPPTS
ncbi:hypothetical protein NFI96_011070, partial [Prochilodus magdalenae]